MVWNYLVVATRNLLRNKGYTTINILGLAIGMVCVILIGLYVRDEFAYDAHHAKSDRIYRILRKTQTQNSDPIYHERTSGGLAVALKEEFPEVEQTVRVYTEWVLVWVGYKDKLFAQKFCVADVSLFNVFDFPLIKGDPDKVLREPFTILLTEEMVKKYFGNEDPIGKVLQVDERALKGDYRVVGVLKNIPTTASIRFDFLISPPSHGIGGWNSWRPRATWSPAVNYILLKEGQQIASLTSKLPEFVNRHLNPEDAKDITYAFQPFDQMYLRHTKDFPGTLSDPSFVYGSANQVYSVAAIGGFILLIACINFMNLATARSANRAREVGVRKVVGAYQSQLIRQFLSESILLALIALCLALAVAAASLATFADFVGKAFTLTSAIDLPMIIGLVVVVLFVGVLAGCYPAFFLSAFRPVVVLKGELTTRAGSAWLRKLLVVFQFSISIVLIIGTVIVLNQLSFLRNKDLGFDKANMIEIPIFWRAKNGTSGSIGPIYQTVKREFSNHPNVVEAAASRFKLGSYSPLASFTVEGQDQTFPMRHHEIDENFITLSDIELIAGKNFSATYTNRDDYGNPEDQLYILSELAVKELGLTNPIGKRFGRSARPLGTIIGVIKDFHVRSLHEKLEPIVLTSTKYTFKHLYLKISANDVPATLAFLESRWKKFLPNRPFEFEFIESNLDQTAYASEIRLSQVFTLFAGIAIFVACLGLFGLAFFIAEQRTKEIGVRKVLGASIFSIVQRLSWDFVKLILIGNLLAWPVAYLAMNQWLQGFAYRVEMGLWIFPAVGIASLALALITVGYQSIRAALSDPVTILKYE